MYRSFVRAILGPLAAFATMSDEGDFQIFKVIGVCLATSRLSKRRFVVLVAQSDMEASCWAPIHGPAGEPEAYFWLSGLRSTLVRSCRNIHVHCLQREGFTREAYANFRRSQVGKKIGSRGVE